MAKASFSRLIMSRKVAIYILKRDDVSSLGIMKRRSARLIDANLKTGNKGFDFEQDIGTISRVKSEARWQEGDVGSL